MIPASNDNSPAATRWRFKQQCRAMLRHAREWRLRYRGSGKRHAELLALAAYWRGKATR